MVEQSINPKSWFYILAVLIEISKDSHTIQSWSCAKSKIDLELFQRTQGWKSHTQPLTNSDIKLNMKL